MGYGGSNPFMGSLDVAFLVAFCCILVQQSDLGGI